MDNGDSSVERAGKFIGQNTGFLEHFSFWYGLDLALRKTPLIDEAGIWKLLIDKDFFLVGQETGNKLNALIEQRKKHHD